METIPLEPKVRKMDFGKIQVCNKCGRGRIPHITEDYKACCEGAILISLRQYVEEVRKEKFDNNKWSFETIDILALSGVDLNAE